MFANTTPTRAKMIRSFATYLRSPISEEENYESHRRRVNASSSTVQYFAWQSYYYYNFKVYGTQSRGDSKN